MQLAATSNHANKLMMLGGGSDRISRCSEARGGSFEWNLNWNRRPNSLKVLSILSLYACISKIQSIQR